MNKHLQLLLLFVLLGFSKSWAAVGDSCTRPKVATLCGNGAFTGIKPIHYEFLDWRYPNGLPVANSGYDTYYQINLPVSPYQPVNVSALLRGHFPCSKCGSPGLVYFLWFKKSPCVADTADFITLDTINGTPSYQDSIIVNYPPSAAASQYYLVVSLSSNLYNYSIQFGYQNSQPGPPYNCTANPAPYRGKLQLDSSVCYNSSKPYKLPLKNLNDISYKSNVFLPGSLNQTTPYFPIDDGNGHGFVLTLKNNLSAQSEEVYIAFDKSPYVYVKSNDSLSTDYTVNLTVFMKNNSGLSGLRGFMMQAPHAQVDINNAFPKTGDTGIYNRTGKWTTYVNPVTATCKWLFNSTNGRGDDTDNHTYGCRVYSFSFHVDNLSDTIKAWYLPDNYGNDPLNCPRTDCDSLGLPWIQLGQNGTINGAGGPGTGCNPNISTCIAGFQTICGDDLQTQNPDCPYGFSYNNEANIQFQDNGCYDITYGKFPPRPFQYVNPDGISEGSSDYGILCPSGVYNFEMDYNNNNDALPTTLVYEDGAYERPVDAQGNIDYNNDYIQLIENNKGALPVYPSNNFSIPLNVQGSYRIRSIDCDSNYTGGGIIQCGLTDCSGTFNLILEGDSIHLDIDSPTVICKGQTLTITASGDPVNYRWLFNPTLTDLGNGMANVNTVHEDFYTVIGTTAGGCTASAVADVQTMDCSVTADFFYEDAFACNLDSIVLIDNSTNATHWNWYFPGGNPSFYDGQYPPQVYYIDGDYSIKLVVSNDFGSMDSLTYDFQVDKCPVEFLLSDSIICKGDCIIVANISTISAPSWNWTFEGGSPASYYGQIPPTVCYDTAGNYTIMLVVTGNQPYNDYTLIKNIAVNDCGSLTAAFIAPDTICGGDCINVTNISAGNATSWLWSFPGGTPSFYDGQTPPQVCYDKLHTGSYTIQLIAGNSLKSDTAVKTIIVNDCSPIADFGNNTYNNEICNNQSIIYGDNSISATAWYWTFNGGNPQYYTGQNPPAIYYATPGLYQTELRVYNYYGFNVSTINIQVDSCTITAAFTAPDIICSTDCITFTDKSSGNITSWQWSFPGGVPSSYSGKTPPLICYNQPGSYTFKLMVGNSSVSDTATGTITVTDCSVKADFDAFNIICSTDCITVTNNSSPGATNWVWSFPGSDLSGYIGETPLPVCYNQPGNYYIKLVASNAFGADSITKSIEVDDCSPQVMVDLNNIYTDFTTICVHDGIKFGVISSNATNYYWNFPGGDVQNDISNDPPPINFNAVGYYKVTLDAWNNYGTITDTFYVKVDSCNVVASFAVDNRSICNGNCVSITDNTNAPTKQWTFTGGNPSSYSGSNPPNVCYSTPGTYTMELVAVNYGKYDTATQTIVVQNCSPTAAFASPDSICNNDCATTTNNSTGNPTSWVWSFEGGNPSTFNRQNPPKVCYADAGSYSISLIVANASGSDTISKTIVVKDCSTPKAVFSANNNICAKDCIAFLSLSTGNITSWNWTFNGGTPSNYNGQYPPIVCFNQPGTYRVTLTVANAYGADSTYNDLVVNDCSPRAGFNGPDSICNGSCISYTNTSSGNSTQWDWQFEGGSPANFTGQYPPPVCYPNGGQYSVRLVASNSYGSDIAYDSILVVNSVAGNITAYYSAFCEGVSPTLSLDDNSGSVQWQVSDTTFGFTNVIGANGSTYHIPKLDHSIYVRVISQAGKCADTSAIFKATVLSPIPLNYTWTDSGLFVLFNSVADSLKNIRYAWNFGDGDTSSIPNPGHLFPKDTSYYVCLSAYEVGFENCEYTYCQTLNVGITGITNPSVTGKMQVYPDPFSDYLLIKSDNKAIKSIELYDVLGRRIISDEIGKGQQVDNVIRLDASGLTDGMYYIRVKTDGADFIQNVVKFGK